MIFFLLFIKASVSGVFMNTSYNIICARTVPHLLTISLELSFCMGCLLIFIVPIVIAQGKSACFNYIISICIINFLVLASLVRDSTGIITAENENDYILSVISNWEHSQKSVFQHETTKHSISE